MTNRAVLVALLILVPALSSVGAENTPEEDAIKKVIAQWHHSFEKRDADLRKGLLTEDTVFFNAFGIEREGKQSVSTFWKELFATGTFDKSEAKVSKERIRFLRPDMAIVDRFEEVTGQRGLETGRDLPPRRVHLTFILTKTNTGWLVAYYRAGDLRNPETAR